MLRADQVEISRMLGMAEGFCGRAEGCLTGRLPISFPKDGPVRLGDLPVGRSRPLTPREEAAIYKTIRLDPSGD